MPDDDKTGKPKDPWKNGHVAGSVHVRTCYAEGCGCTHGCLVLISKRVVTFDNECQGKFGDCEHKDKPSCYARSSARLVEQPAICHACSLKIS